MNFLPRLVSNPEIFTISVSWVARIIGMSHHTWLQLVFGRAQSLQWGLGYYCPWRTPVPVAESQCSVPLSSCYSSGVLRVPSLGPTSSSEKGKSEKVDLFTYGDGVWLVTVNEQGRFPDSGGSLQSIFSLLGQQLYQHFPCCALELLRELLITACLCFIWFYFETGSHFVTQAGLELLC
jgi:hypothetical protein